MVQMPYNERAVEVKIAGCPQVGLEEAAVERRLIRGFGEARFNEAASNLFPVGRPLERDVPRFPTPLRQQRQKTFDRVSFRAVTFVAHLTLADKIFPATPGRPAGLPARLS